MHQRDIESAKACLEELRPIIRILNKLISSSKVKMKR